MQQDLHWRFEKACKACMCSLCDMLTYVVRTFATQVMSDFDSSETNWFLHPECTRGGWVWVDVDLPLFNLVHLRFSSLGPFHLDELVAVLVKRCHFESDVVFQCFIKSFQTHFCCWKEPPVACVYISYYQECDYVTIKNVQYLYYRYCTFLIVSCGCRIT